MATADGLAGAKLLGHGSNTPALPGHRATALALRCRAPGTRRVFSLSQSVLTAPWLLPFAQLLPHLWELTQPSHVLYGTIPIPEQQSQLGGYLAPTWMKGSHEPQLSVHAHRPGRTEKGLSGK